MAQSNSLAAFALDDFESRSGSATSVVRTISGLYLRHAKGPVGRQLIIELAKAAGVSAPAAQTAVSRLLDRGLLENVDTSTLRVSDPALSMFARGNRRIFTPRQMSASDAWVLVTYSLPESLRATRHQLRKHFGQLGGGQVSAGLWIFPQYLHEEVNEILLALDAREYATLFVTSSPPFPTTPIEAAEKWWDLTYLTKIHHGFIAAVAGLDSDATDPALAYRGYVSLIDAWRALPYLDPGLPDLMLPAQWPGTASRARFLELSLAYRDKAKLFADNLLNGLA